MFAVLEFVRQALGATFVDPPPFSIAESTAEATAETPIIFVLSPGADPFSLLVKHAEEQGYRNRMHAISLGQGVGRCVGGVGTRPLIVCLWRRLLASHHGSF